MTVGRRESQITLRAQPESTEDSALTDIGDGRSNSDFDAGVAFLGQFSLEELVQLSVEHTVSNKLAALRDSALRCSHGPC